MKSNYHPLKNIVQALGYAPVTKASKSAPFSLDSIKAELDRLTDAEKSAFERIYQKVLEMTGDALKALTAGQGAVARLKFGLAVKARKSDSGVIVAGWGILFGDMAHKDLDGQYFGPNTQYFLEDFGQAPLFIEHGADANVRSLKAGNRTSAEVYPDYGIWMEHRISPDMPAFKVLDYEKVVQAIEDGEIHYSSDSMLHHVQGGFNPAKGELTIWPLAGVSLVQKPAEPGLGPVIAKAIEENI